MTVSLRGFRIGLIVSLALNVFLIALAVTFWIGRDAHGHGGPRPGLMPSPRRLLAHLDEADRPRLEKLMTQHRSAMRADIGRVMAARDAVSAALKATPYSRTDAEAAFTQLRARADSITQRAQDSVLELADQLDDSGRAKLADAIAGEHREWRDRSRRRHARRHESRATDDATTAPAAAPASTNEATDAPPTAPASTDEAPPEKP